jgi:NifU-like protein involved in Fe-S cluster formation
MAAPLYNVEILRLASTIPYLGRLKTPQGSAERRSPLCGSRVVVDVMLDDAGRISQLGVEPRACALGQASTSLMAAHVIGHTPEEMAEVVSVLTDYLAGIRSDSGTWPGLEIFAPARQHTARHASIRLPFEAVAAAAKQAKADA